MSNKIEMSLESGRNTAERFLEWAQLTNAVVAGSIRRQRPIVHDIDLVFDCSPASCSKPIHRWLVRIQTEDMQILRWGPKLAAITYHGVPIDLYFSTPETFHTLLLIRTGSKESNIRLCSIAKARGWKLHASGEGLFNERGERIAGDSERSIYDALGVPWQEPWERG